MLSIFRPSRTWLRRRLGLLGLLGHAACASHIAEGNVAPRVPPSVVSVAGVRACWLEFAQGSGFTASGILVRHPQGNALVDAGQSRNFTQEIEGYPFSDWWYLKLVPGGLTPDRPAADVVRDAGVDPASLRLFLATHAHSDHVGGLMDLPDVPIQLPQAEIDVLHGAVTQAPFNVLPAHAKRMAGHLTALVFLPVPYEVFAEHADVFGDGSLVAVPLAGHTPGSIGVFVNTAKERVFYVGDALNEVAAMDDLRGKRLLLRRTDANPPAADAVVAQLAALHRQLPSLRILPAHDRAAWLRLFGAPLRCVGVGQ